MPCGDLAHLRVESSGTKIGLVKSEETNLKTLTLDCLSQQWYRTWNFSDPARRSKSRMMLARRHHGSAGPSQQNGRRRHRETGHKQRSDICFKRSARCQCAPTDQRAQAQANTTVRTRIESTSPAGLEMPANLETCREPKVCKRFPIRYLFFSWCNNFFHYSGTRIIQPSS